ncbi:hypothetical protein Y032_0001g435 [Ancylostoma ceylanicum]|uniref:Uncharacterized protein n=2 Tax=Ancylostoma ceylanicum TaxID=53326 RepID=A0A016W4B1_9BILA|nr:hypothetical protein Y032_0001g435 [Ancylostoma ceylanicum]
MVDAIMSRPPDYYCMTYGDFEEEDAASSSQTSKETSKRPSECSMEDAVRDVHGRLNSLAAENLSLNEKLSRQSEELTEARAQLRGYTGGLGLSLEKQTPKWPHPNPFKSLRGRSWRGALVTYQECFFDVL